MTQGHPNLSPEINEQLKSLDDMKGLFVNDLPEGYAAEAVTKSGMVYRVTRNGECVVGRARVVGSNLTGSTWGGSIIRLNWIGVGMHMEFGKWTTTPVADLNIVKEATR